MLPTESSPIASQPQVLMTQEGQVPVDVGQLQAFVASLCRKRDKAVSGRRSSGIESDWLEDEEFYQGIDDANRQFVRSWVATIKRGIPAQQLPDQSKSAIFLNITRPYVDAAAARLADMLLPLDERCWAIKPTPIAELDPSTTAKFQELGIDPQQLLALQAQIQGEADRAAELMGDEIDDHLIECQWHGEVRAVVEDSARIGAGVLKGPVPMRRTYKKWVSQPPEGANPIEKLWFYARRTLGKIMGKGSSANLQIVSEIKPGSVRIDPWNFYPDPACGENIHNGQETWERAYTTPKQLRDMGLMPGFDAKAIADILEEGPKQLTSREAGDGTYVPVLGQYEMWTFYGTIAQQDASVSGLDLNDQTPLVNAMAILVNDKLIKITLNALDTGEYPYDVLAWQRRPGVPWGMGIARHIRTPQRMLNAAARAMMDNSGMTAAPQIVLGNGVTPADGKMEVRGKKLWLANPEVVDVTKAFYCYIPESHQEEFERIIRLAQEIAEQTTGMPMLLQGQSPQGGKGTDTLGGMQLLQNNASGVLRRLAKRFDDFLTEPHIRRYYDWLMQYSPRDDIKGDFQIDAQGSSSLVERDANKQFMFAAMNFAKDPAFGIDPYKLFKELAKSDRIDPKKLQFDEADYQQRVGKPSELDQAKTTLAQAQASNQEAQGILAKVQALFSAITTANAVALNPALAPAADITAKSAGFVDADQPPAIGTPEPGTAPMPAGAPTAAPAAAASAVGAPSNTHPGFPPSADSGVGKGIEGGR
jgi:hypothetical protein